MEESPQNIRAEQPPVVDEPSWGVSWAIFGYLGFLMVQFVPALIIGFVYSFYCLAEGMNIPKDVSDFPVMLLGSMAIISQLLNIVWVFYLIRFAHRMPFRRGISWDGARSIAEWKAAMSGLALMLFNAGLSIWLVPPEGAKIPLEELTRTNGGLALFGFMAIFIAPISEEILFRGYMFAPFERRWGSKAAIAITSLLFMTPHLAQLGDYWQGVILIGLLGVVAGALRAYTGGLRAPVICHFVYNFFLVLIEVLGRIAPG